MDKIEKFLQDYTAKQTIVSYRSQLNNYFKAIDVKDVNKYFDSDRDYKADVETFWRSIKGKPPLSIKTAISIVKNFLEYYDVVIPNKIWKSLKRKIRGSMAWTIDKAPSNQILKQILIRGGVREKAMFLICSSSGMRIDEVMSLTPEDIDMKSNPTMITISASHTKSGNPRYCFISNEATEYLEEWYKERDDYLRTAVERSKNKTHQNGRPIFVKSMDDTRIFPYTYHTARLSWLRLLKKAGYDQKDKTTGVYIYHIHTLRKYFMSRMKLELPETVVEALAGHSKYLTEAYRRYSQEQLAEMYVKGMSTITVFESQPDLSEVHEQLKNKDTEIQELNKRLEAMDRDLRKLMIDRLTENDREKK